MQSQLRSQTLIGLFNGSIEKVSQLEKICLQVFRMKRQEQVTFQQIKHGSENFALWLMEQAHIKVADKIAILGKNRADWDVALWAAILAGAVPVLIDPERGVEGVMNHLHHTDARLLVMADDYQDDRTRQDLKDRLSSHNIALVEMTDAPLCQSMADSRHLLRNVRPRIKSDDTAVIICTSGTTGDPREVELSHANLITNIQGCLQKIKITADDNLGHILPPHHSFGLTVGKLLPFCIGATNVYTNKYRQIPDLIRDKKITIFLATPTLFIMLARRIEESLDRQKLQKPLTRLLDNHLPAYVGKRILKEHGWTRLRFFLSGAAPVPRWVLNIFWRRGLKLYEGYGTTENSPVYGFNDSPRKLGSVGKPIPTLLVKIVGEQDQTLRPGQKGEICLGGPCVMKGYYKNPNATNAVIKTDGTGVRWLHTGDLGYLDNDGNLFITGRKKYVIVLPGGKNINPELVESALSEARFVREILVVPTLSTNSVGIRQETIKAIAQPAWYAIEEHTNLSYTQLIEQPQLLKNLVWQSINECQHGNRQLAAFERITSRHLEIKIDEFQRTSTGKIKRQVYTNL